MAKQPIMAIMYDFDKTLCNEDMQNYGFIPAMGMTPAEFWGETSKFSEKEGVERILSYMYMMVKTAKDKGIKLTKEWLNSLGKDITYYPGVTTWFKRINEYGQLHGVKIEHYLVSSGTKEIVDGCSIAKEFKELYGCEFYFDEKTKEPIWPKLAINYTQKTQYLFRISKGITNKTEDNKLNSKTVNRRIPYRNIVYLGDGMTDIPIMLLCKENGGNSIAVYQKGKRDKVEPLLNEERVNFICEADYSKNSDLEKVCQGIIDLIAIQTELEQKQEKLNDIR